VEEKTAMNLAETLQRELQPVVERLEQDRAADVQRAAVEIREKLRMLELCRSGELDKAKAELAELRRSVAGPGHAEVGGIHVHVNEEPATMHRYVFVRASDEGVPGKNIVHTTRVELDEHGRMVGAGRMIKGTRDVSPSIRLDWGYGYRGNPAAEIEGFNLKVIIPSMAERFVHVQSPEGKGKGVLVFDGNGNLIEARVMSHKTTEPIKTVDLRT